MNNLKREKGTQIYHSSVERDLSSFFVFYRWTYVEISCIALKKRLYS